ncbi:MAG TPA: serine/threonine dehydratase [Acidimicrobiales bacterium]|nr:serine/threonine dehydratase [Acidimicrobiales bacterium]
MPEPASGALRSLTTLDDDAIGREEVTRVLPAIRGHVRTTPVIRIDRAELGLSPGPLVLKLEHLQHSGSFKARGAFANLVLRDIPEAGVVAASGGNHGAAVAYAAAALGIPATVFVPEVSSPAKLARIQAYGARLVVGGASYDDARKAAARWGESTGALDIPAFDSVLTILGAGSIALELQEQAPDVQTVFAGVGGGGLLAGLCAGYERAATVMGVEPEGAPTLTEALRAGGPTDAPVGSVAIDSLAPRRVGRHTYRVAARLASGTVLVDDATITATEHLLWDRLRLVLEPGGCAALGALVSGRYESGPNETVAVVLSGANTTAVAFDR